MVLWRTSRAVRRKAEKATDGLFLMRRRPWAPLTAFTTRASFTVSLVCLVLLAFCGYGLTKIDTSVNIRDLLKPESTTIRDYRWLESAIGPLVTVEAIVKIPEGTGLDVLDELELVSDVETALRSRESIGGTLSAATFLPEIPPFAPRDYLRRVKMRRVIERKIDQLATSGYLAREEEANFWRVTGRVPAFGNFDYGVIRNRIAEHVDQVISDYKDELAASSGDTPLEEIDVVYTGSMPLVYDTQRELLDDLVTSFLWALGLVALVMILVQRSIIGGLIVMIPNLFPTVILFGAMGWRGQAVDIGGMMTASIALGIAVDGTLHFLTWFRRELDDGSDPRDAVGKTYRHCATAMAQTTVICGTGLSVFALSDFVPSQRFAWMMVTLLVVALVGDLILLPALLVGPFARWFRPKDVSRAPQEKISSDETSRDEAALPTSPSENGAARSPESTKVTSPHPVDTPDS